MKLISKLISRSLSLLALCGIASVANASIIPVTAFSGSETIITFNELGGFAPPVGPFSIGSVTFSEASTGNGAPGWRLIGASLGGEARPFLADNAGISDIMIDFTTPINRAGLVAGIGPGTYLVSAYDTSLNFLESTVITPVNTFDGSFVGFQQNVSIGRIRIQETSGANGFVGGIDTIRFENVGAAVPEPGSVALLVGAGIGGLMLRRRKK